MFHCLPLQRKGKLRSKADRAGHESPGKDCGWPYQTVGVNRRFPVGFVPGRGTTDAFFVVRQLQEKYLAANKRLYMAFTDLEKESDRVPQKVSWLMLRKLDVEEWTVRMYDNAQSRVTVGESTGKSLK